MRYRKEVHTISHKELLERLSYSQHTGDFHWKYNPSRPRSWNTRYSGTVAGTPQKDGRKYVSIDKTLYITARLAWFYVYEIWPISDLDHINNIPGDDRIENLREVTQSQNNMNASIRSDNKSGYKGVTWHTGAKKWRAKIKVDGKQIHLGFFKDARSAGLAYNEAAQKYFGEFSRANLDNHSIPQIELGDSK